MIWSLQILRFVAASMILYLHAAIIATRVTGSNGFIPHALAAVCHSGVDIFFVISGVIIARIAPGSNPSEFIVARIRRIIPMYLICTVPTLATAISAGFGWRDALATFLLWPATDRMTAPILLVGWTLCFEMLFYISVGLVLLQRRWFFVIIGAYGAALVLRPIGPVFQFLGNPIILEFFLGVAVAYMPAWRLGAWAIPCGVVMLACAGLMGITPADGVLDSLHGREAFWRVLVYGIPAAMIVYGTMQIEARQSVWTYLGNASYSLYLTHTLPLTALPALWAIYPVPTDLRILIGIAAALLLAWRVHERFEKPIMTLSKRLSYGVGS
jgi:exopolysaccharide production protein ExoZ